MAKFLTPDATRAENGLVIKEKLIPDGSKLYLVQAGIYAVKSNAEALQKRLRKAGFESIIKEV